MARRRRRQNPPARWWEKPWVRLAGLALAAVGAIALATRDTLAAELEMLDDSGPPPPSPEKGDDSAPPAVDDATITGVDVSHYQLAPDWPQVKSAGHSFAWIKATEGTRTDPQFQSNWDGAAAAGLFRGAYCFFEPTKDPVAQADAICDLVGTLGPGDLGIAIDLEESPSSKNNAWSRVPSKDAKLAMVKAWLSQVQQRTGRTPIVYTYKAFWESNFGPDSQAAACPLWIASYSNKPGTPVIPSNWSAWTFWQYTGKGSSAGISTAVDLNQFHGSRSDLEQLAGGAPPVNA